MNCFLKMENLRGLVDCPNKEDFNKFFGEFL